MAMVQRLSPLLPDEFTAEPRVHLGAPPEPTLAIDVDLADQYAYEVLVYDQSRGGRLVAAVEIVSPANKDRTESRRAFVAKCAALLHQGVCVSMVDVVTTRHFNLYTDLLTMLDRSDPAFATNPAFIYAVTCRVRKLGTAFRLETWLYPLTIGAPLHVLPFWLTDELAVPLELDESYEETCRVLRIDRA